MDKGDILHSPQHDFGADSTPSDKFLILLNNPGIDKAYVFVFVNSKDVWRGRESGCHNKIRDAHFVIDKGQDWFDHDKTFVIFRNAEVLSKKEVAACQKKGNLQRVEKLRKNMLKAIIKCFEESQDISGYMRDLINPKFFKRDF